MNETDTGGIQPSVFLTEILARLDRPYKDIVIAERNGKGQAMVEFLDGTVLWFSRKHEVTKQHKDYPWS